MSKQERDRREEEETARDIDDLNQFYAEEEIKRKALYAQLTELNPALRKEAEYIDIDQPEEKTAREMALEIEIADLRRDNEDLRSRIAKAEKREEERDRELRSVMLSFVSWVEKTHGWQSREEKQEKRKGRVINA